jgi:hypothetical protein
MREINKLSAAGVYVVGCRLIIDACMHMVSTKPKQEKTGSPLEKTPCPDKDFARSSVRRHEVPYMLNY